MRVKYLPCAEVAANTTKDKQILENVENLRKQDEQIANLQVGNGVSKAEEKMENQTIVEREKIIADLQAEVEKQRVQIFDLQNSTRIQESKSMNSLIELSFEIEGQCQKKIDSIVKELGKKNCELLNDIAAKDLELAVVSSAVLKYEDEIEEMKAELKMLRARVQPRNSNEHLQPCDTAVVDFQNELEKARDRTILNLRKEVALGMAKLHNKSLETNHLSEIMLKMEGENATSQAKLEEKKRFISELQEVKGAQDKQLYGAQNRIAHTGKVQPDVTTEKIRAKDVQNREHFDTSRAQDKRILNEQRKSIKKAPGNSFLQAQVKDYSYLQNESPKAQQVVSTTSEKVPEQNENENTENLMDRIRLSLSKPIFNDASTTLGAEDIVSTFSSEGIPLSSSLVLQSLLYQQVVQ